MSSLKKPGKGTELLAQNFADAAVECLRTYGMKDEVAATLRRCVRRTHDELPKWWQFRAAGDRGRAARVVGI